MIQGKKEQKRVSTECLIEMKKNGERISMLTAYDFTMAKIIDRSGIDVILVGDSASNVMAGHQTTLSITLNQMIYHASSVVRACDRSLVVVDIPFGGYQSESKIALNSAVKIIKKSGAHAVKMEGGSEIEEGLVKIIQSGIPVMGHLGLMPQSIHQYGSYGVRAKQDAEARKVLADAKFLEKKGCFAVVLEKVPSKLAKEVAENLTIPVIGIGAGSDVDGQVLVTQDMLGMNYDFHPRFLRKYLNLYEEMTEAFKKYDTDVRMKNFPNEKESY